MGEWGTSTKEYRLVDFQQWIGRQITPDDLIGTITLSNNPKSVRQRKWREKKKKKKDYEDRLNQMREEARRKK